MNNLVVCIMGQDCREYLEVCLESVKEADAIVYCDGGSKQEMIHWLFEKGFNRAELRAKHLPQKWIIQQEYKQDDQHMNGKQRNFYLDYLKKHYMGWWCLCLDADEVLSDGGVQVLKNWEPEYGSKNALYGVHMRHLQGDFRYEDATRERHYVPNRLFRVREELFYPLGEHVVLNAKDDTVLIGQFDGATIFHLAYAPMFHVRRRYEKNLKHSNVHSRGFLDSWYRAHVFGTYPKREIDPRDLPTSLLRAFHVEPDELYFQGRDVEAKHFLMVKQWKDHLLPDQYMSQYNVLDLGCGRGPYLAAWNFLGVPARGVELSAWAAERPVWGARKDQIIVGDIAEYEAGKKHSLVTLIDVLEHLEEPAFDKAVTNAIRASAYYILVSAPFEGDPNLYNDKTHKIFKPREWWIEQFTKHGCEEVPVPEEWLYRHQLLLFKVPG